MRTTNLVSILACCFAGSLGCYTPKSSLGELPASSEGSEGSESETTQVSATTMIGAVPDTDVGEPCELSGIPESALLDLGNAGCRSGLCLYPDRIMADAEQTCSESSECAGFGEGVICGADGHCQLDPVHIAEASMCTAECNDAADCVASDGTACEGGFACIPVTGIGPTCCLKFCACVDDFDAQWAAELEARCDAGVGVGC